MRGDIQFQKDNYPYRLDSGIVRGKDPSLYLVVDHRTQEVLLETLDVNEAVAKHKELKDAYYASDVGLRALEAQQQQDASDRNKAIWAKRDQSEDRDPKDLPAEAAYVGEVRLRSTAIA